MEDRPATKRDLAQLKTELMRMNYLERRLVEVEKKLFLEPPAA
jgi:hypothetical protein